MSMALRPRAADCALGNNVAVSASRLRIGVRRQCSAHEIREPFAALDVIAELIEARARGRKQHDITIASERQRPVDCSIEGPQRLEMCRRTAKTLRDQLAVAPDQQHRATGTIDGRFECGEALTLAIAAGDQNDWTTHAVER